MTSTHPTPAWMADLDAAAKLRQAHEAEHGPFGPPPGDVDDDDWLTTSDAIDASSWFTGVLLLPRAIAHLARAALGAFKSSPAAEPGIGSPDAGVDAPASGDLPNP
ncbi:MULTISPECIES: hypothetical protein [unclassified Nocardia]|uniref:hypothetical protein n=1 Tax=unclassified Nocardia TaxID=2637762 RepID=UPI00278C4748|nr:MULTISPECIES: hypothetical protein [unclassified Nocardia]